MASKADDKRTDDLTSIKGIGNATARSLRKLEVRSFQDLATLSVDEVEAGLKRSSGRSIPRKQIKGWLAQARELAPSAPSQVKASNGHGNAEKSKRSRRGKWKPFATFVVEFQAREGGEGVEKRRTVCQQHETAKERKWPGLEGPRLAEWMLKQIDEEIEESEQQAEVAAPRADSSTEKEEPSFEAQPASNEETADLPVTMEITQIRMSQPPSGASRLIATSDEGFGGVLRSGEPVLFELSLELGGPAATEIARSRTRFNAEIYAHNRSTAADMNLSEPSFTREGQLSYTAVLPAAELERGAYRLDCLATLDANPRHQSYLRVPVIRVV